MKNASGNHIHPQYAVPPENFRAQATGIGQSLEASRRTGAARAQRVVDQTPPGCMKAVPAAEGYPARTPNDMASLYAS